MMGNRRWALTLSLKICWKISYTKAMQKKFRRVASSSMHLPSSVFKIVGQLKNWTRRLKTNKRKFSRSMTMVLCVKNIFRRDARDIWRTIVERFSMITSPAHRFAIRKDMLMAPLVFSFQNPFLKPSVLRITYRLFHILRFIPARLAVLPFGRTTRIVPGLRQHFAMISCHIHGFVCTE